MVNYPASLDSLANPTESTYTDDSGFELDIVVSNLNDIAEALETKLGTGTSVATTTGHVLTVTGAGATAYQYPVLTPLEAALGADVAMNNTANFFDGPSVSLTAGTWLLIGSVHVQDTAGIAGILAKLWDGTTVESSGQLTTAAASHTQQITLSGIVTVGSTTTWKISARDISSTSGLIKAATTSASQGNNASYLRAVRIA